MKWKAAFLAVVLSIAFLAAVAAGDQSKSYRITISSASKIGTTEFKPGDYELVVNQPKVRFTEIRTGKSVELEAKVDNLEEKVESTTIHSETVDGVSMIRQIRIGGSKTRIAFD
jgi:type 1 fimbria pilin